MKPSEEERALDALFRAGRMDPSVDDLGRLERRLSPWLDAAPAQKPLARGHLVNSILLLIGFGLLSPTIRTELRPQPTAALAEAEAAVAVVTPIHDEPVAAPSAEATVPVSSLPNAPLAVVVAKPALGHPTATPEKARVPAESEPIESEASFLRRAQGALASDPGLALQMLQQHPTRYPHGALVQEREVMAIDSLARLGRVDEARERAHAFVARYPQSAHESRIASILGEGAK